MVGDLPHLRHVSEFISQQPSGVARTANPKAEPGIPAGTSDGIDEFRWADLSPVMQNAAVLDQGDIGHTAMLEREFGPGWQRQIFPTITASGSRDSPG